jgi:hypothetical protein
MLALYQLDSPKPPASAADKLRAMVVDQRKRGSKS